MNTCNVLCIIYGILLSCVLVYTQSQWRYENNGDSGSGDVSLYTLMPQNSYGLVGNDTTLLCAVHADSTSQVQWWNNSGVQITSGEKSLYPDKYAVISHPPGTYNLIILDVNLSDAGQYHCRLDTDNVRAFAELIVLGEVVHDTYCPMPPIPWLQQKVLALHGHTPQSL